MLNQVVGQIYASFEFHFWILCLYVLVVDAYARFGDNAYACYLSMWNWIVKGTLLCIHVISVMI